MKKLIVLLLIIFALPGYAAEEEDGSFFSVHTLDTTSKELKYLPIQTSKYEYVKALAKSLYTLKSNGMIFKGKDHFSNIFFYNVRGFKVIRGDIYVLKTITRLYKNNKYVATLKANMVDFYVSENGTIYTLTDTGTIFQGNQAYRSVPNDTKQFEIHGNTILRINEDGEVFTDKKHLYDM